MTVREYIIEATIKSLTERVSKLEKLGAPRIMCEAIHEELADLNADIFKCGGDVEYLEDELITVESRKGNGGKSYYIFNGYIRYFPMAKYGRYVKKGERE